MNEEFPYINLKLTKNSKELNCSKFCDNIKYLYFYFFSQKLSKKVFSGFFFLHVNILKVPVNNLRKVPVNISKLPVKNLEQTCPWTLKSAREHELSAREPVKCPWTNFSKVPVNLESAREQFLVKCPKKFIHRKSS